MSNDPRANHVRQKFEFPAVPNEHDRTRTAAPINLRNTVRFQRGNFHFILQDAGGPQQPNHVRAAFRSKSRQNIRGTLAQIA